MAKAKSKEFILKRWQRKASDLIPLKPGEKKRVRITIKEIK